MSFYNSRISWWIPAVVAITCAGCIVGPALEGDYVAGLVLGLAVAVIEIVIYAGVKYRIDGNMLGVRSFFRWKWYPIEKISEIKPHRSVLAAPALSFRRLAIRFSDKSILKSAMPLEISPKDEKRFLREIKAINPDIKIRPEV